MEKVLKVHNPNNLPTMPYAGFREFQGDLKNPMTPEDLKKMCESLKKHGVFVPKFVWFDADQQANILDGHQTKQALLSLEEDGWEIPGIPYVVIEAESREDAAEKLLQINSRYAVINPESEWVKSLSNVEQILSSIAIPEFSLDISPGVDFPTNGDGKDETYTKKIVAPTYEPKNEKPEIDDLVDTEKTENLVFEIQSTDIPKKEKDFLIQAAQRHTIFNYQKIADYYAHSSTEVQELMEKSALVIIDFDKAIEYGYTKLSEDIASQYLEEHRYDS